MRETRNSQAIMFDLYAEHEHAKRLRKISDLLDQHPINLIHWRRICFDPQRKWLKISSLVDYHELPSFKKTA